MTERATLKRHADLVDRMATKLGIDLQEATLSGDIDMYELAGAVVRCSNCDSPDSCERWLDEQSSADAPPEFCGNAEILNRLRQR